MLQKLLVKLFEEIVSEQALKNAMMESLMDQTDAALRVQLLQIQSEIMVIRLQSIYVAFDLMDMLPTQLKLHEQQFVAIL